METATSQQYRLRWNNHRSNLLNVFDELLKNEAFTDVTLAVEGNVTIRCHKIVLAACSIYFQNLFYGLPCKHPIIVLKDVKPFEIKAILEYMYHGEVNVAQEQLAGLLKVAEALKVKGLIDENGDSSSGSVHGDSRRDDRHMETSMSPPPAISTSTSAGSIIAHNSAHETSPPHSTDSIYSPYNKPIDQGHNRLALSMWSLSGLPLHHAHQSSSHPSSAIAILGGSSYDNGFENMSFKHKKLFQSNLLMNRDTPILRTVLGQGHADSSQTSLPALPPPESHESVNFRTNSNGSTHDNDNRRSSTDLVHGETGHSPYTDSFMDEDEKQPSPQSFPSDSKSGIGNYQQKPEWKRYKQYTRDDISSAIEAVRSGMSAVQAARKHGVPSRTLYDKVKKLGITTSRPFKRSTANGSSGACFPYGIGGNVNGGIYSGALSETETESGGVNLPESTAGRSAGPPESVYAKTKDISQDRDSISDSMMTSCSPSPVIRCTKQKQQQEDMDDQVEDLSVSRKSDVPVIVPPSTMPDTIKIETEDIGPDNSDCCDYNS